MDRYELHDRQERIARDHVRWLKAFYTSLIVGVFFLALPRAVPWISSGIPTSAMGRPIGVIHSFTIEPFFLIGILHMVLAIIYGFIIAALIFRFKVGFAIFLGGVIGFVLYVANFAFFRLLLGTPPANEFTCALTSILFGLFYSAAYKAISVPDASRVS